MSEREWRFYLDDMIGFAEKVIAYTLVHFTQFRIVRRGGRAYSSHNPRGEFGNSLQTVDCHLQPTY